MTGNCKTLSATKNCNFPGIRFLTSAAAFTPVWLLIVFVLHQWSPMTWCANVCEGPHAYNVCPNIQTDRQKWTNYYILSEGNNFAEAVEFGLSFGFILGGAAPWDLDSYNRANTGRDMYPLISRAFDDTWSNPGKTHMLTDSRRWWIHTKHSKPMEMPHKSACYTVLLEFVRREKERKRLCMFKNSLAWLVNTLWEKTPLKCWMRIIFTCNTLRVSRD